MHSVTIYLQVKQTDTYINMVLQYINTHEDVQGTVRLVANITLRH